MSHLNYIASLKLIMKRIEDTKLFRESSSRPQTQKLADTPYLFGEIRQPETTMLAIPKVSSENRRYIPIAFVEPEIIVSGSFLFIPEADLFDFVILMSNVHNAWTRAVCGRMKSDYQYSASIVYNNFVWCKPTDQQIRLIQLVPILIGITFLTFGMMQFTADDAVDVIYEKGVATGDMGRSFISGKLVFETFTDKLPAMIELMLVSIILTILVAKPLEIIAAVKK